MNIHKTHKENMNEFGEDLKNTPNVKPQDIDEMKKIYEASPSDWVVYFKLKNENCFYKATTPIADGIFNLDHFYCFKLIHKNHEKIADAVVADSGVEVVSWNHSRDSEWKKVKDFFAEYDKNLAYNITSHKCNACSLEFATCKAKNIKYGNGFGNDNVISCDSYRLKETKPNFNNGYIKASQEDLSEVVVLLSNLHIPFNNTPHDTDLHKITIEGNEIKFYPSMAYVKDLNQFYINNKALSWDEPHKPLEEMTPEYEGGVKGFSDKEIEPISAKNAQVEITSDDGTVYEFEKPEFECELYAVKTNSQDIVIIGAIKNKQDVWWESKWSISGKDFNSATFNLTPIKQKEEIQFPALMTTEYKEFTNANNKDTLQTLLKMGWRLATKAEIDSLFYEGKE